MRERTPPALATLSRWFDPAPTSTAQPPQPWPLARHPLLN